MTMQTTMKQQHLSLHPRLCFVGALVGRNPGYITIQAEILSDHFKAAGYPVTTTSSAVNRYARLVDIVTTLIRHGRSIDMLMIQIYAGRSFVVEDIASRIGHHFGHRMIMHLHGGVIPEFAARFPHWTQRVLGRADALVAPSIFLAQAIQPYGLHAHIIPNVIDLHAYPFRSRHQLRPTLFWMRSFHEFYNPMMAVRVLARVRAIWPDATLVMAGRDKGLESKARLLGQELGLDQAIRFPGFLDMTNKVHGMDVADIFINTNHIDNMPVAVVEAAAMGLPIVATAVGGVPDLLTDNNTALLVPNDDDEAMANAILRLLDNPDLARHLSLNGRHLAERSSWEQVYPLWTQLFAELGPHPV